MKNRITNWLNRNYATMKFSVAELDGGCPYDSTEIDLSQSFCIMKDGYIFGRVLRWLDGEKGWLLEWDYCVPVNPTSSATWLSYFCADTTDAIDSFDKFIYYLEWYFAAFEAFSNLPMVRSFTYTGPLVEMRKAWGELGFQLVSE